MDTRCRYFLAGCLLTILPVLLLVSGCAQWLPGGENGPGSGAGNQPPVIAGNTISASDTSPTTAQEIKLAVAVSDPDSQQLSFSWSDGNPNSGEFSGSGPEVFWHASAPGTYQITLTVSDQSGGTATQTLALSVTSATAGPNSAPVSSGEIKGDVTNPVAGQKIVLSTQFSDPDGDQLLVIWDDGTGQPHFSEETVTADGKATASWRPPAAGTYTVTATASDGKAVSAVTSAIDVASGQFTIAAFPATFNYSGMARCAMCHADIAEEETGTKHAHIEELMQSRGLGRLESCRVCHNVGYRKGGYIDYELTPQFANVQCESCHGSGIGHPANGPLPASWDPKDNCGVCHTEGHHPTYDEWQLSTHGSFDLTAEKVREGACVRCHNGKYFVKIQIDGEEEPKEELPESEATHIVCATCHDPHNGQYEAQLRTDSHADVIMPFDNTPVNAAVANICIHCHNGRRTRKNMEDNITQGGGRFGVHHNNQGNLFFAIGAIEFEGTDYDRDHPHRELTEKKCVTCHMPKEEFVGPEDPAYTGHTFFPRYEACLPCHVNASNVTEMETFTKDFQQDIKDLLAEFEAAWPAEWKDLSNPENPKLFNRPEPTGNPPHDGPPVDDSVGNEYRRALWDYVYIEEDFSYGVHNPTYARQLLQSAIAKVNELNAQ